MDDYTALNRGNDVFRALNGDATSPVYGPGLREVRPEDFHVPFHENYIWHNDLAFLIGAIAFTIMSFMFW